MTGAAPGSIDLEKYAEWFHWARSAHARELDATHAAAEAAYRSELAGGSHDEAVAAAESAGAEPVSVDPKTMALAEWASWARSTAGSGPAASLVVARHALATVESSHDLDSAMSEVLSMSAPQSRTSEPRMSPGNRNALIVAGVVIGSVVLLGAGAGVLNAANQGPAGKGATPASTATLEVSLHPSGDADLHARGLPAGKNVYIFVDDTWELMVPTDSSGSLSATVPIPLGGHTVSVCLDGQAIDCPATSFVSRTP